MSAFKNGFIFHTKRGLCVLLSLLALTISFPQIISAADPQPLNVSGSVTYLVAGDPVLVAPGLILTDTLDMATVSIDSGFIAGDYLGIQGQAGTSGTTLSGIDWSYSSATGIMTLQNLASAADYQAVLRQIVFYNTSGTFAPSARTIGFSVNSSSYLAATGHYYEYVNLADIPWTIALTAAAGRTYFGLQGYLATITSQTEQDFIQNLKGNHTAWLGATDSDNESNWRWITGPEGAVNAGTGTYFFHQTRAVATSDHYINNFYLPPAGSGGDAVDGRYNHWNFNQPDDSSATGENYMHLYADGYWNDLPDTFIFLPIEGYIVEYGGMTGDPTPQLNGNVIVNLELQADLSITKTDSPDPVIAGDNLTYTIIITNNGPHLAENITLTDSLPAELTGAQFSLDNGTTWYPWTSPAGLDNLTSGNSIYVTIRGKVASSTPPGSLSNSASVRSDSSDPTPDPDNNTSAAATEVDTQADLAVTQSQSFHKNGLGYLITYTITVTNNGPSDATGVSLTHILTGGGVVKSSFTGNGTYAGGLWSGFGLVSGDSAVLTLVVDVDVLLLLGTFINSVEVSADQTDPVLTNNTGSDTLDLTRNRYVGGEVSQPNKLVVAAPWLALCLVLGLVGVLWIRKRSAGK